MSGQPPTHLLVADIQQLVAAHHHYVVAWRPRACCLQSSAGQCRSSSRGRYHYEEKTPTLIASQIVGRHSVAGTGNLHWLGSARCSCLTWSFNSARLLKWASQLLHLWGLKVVCVTMCLVSELCVVNMELQSWQVNSFTSRCIFLCFDSASWETNALRQIVHWNGRSAGNKSHISRVRVGYRSYNQIEIREFI